MMGTTGPGRLPSLTHGGFSPDERFSRGAHGSSSGGGGGGVGMMGAGFGQQQPLSPGMLLHSATARAQAARSSDQHLAGIGGGPGGGDHGGEVTEPVTVYTRM